MRFRFTGEYTGNRNSITCKGVTFMGHDPVDVEDEDAIEHLRRHPEFEAVQGRPKKDEK